MSVILEAKNLNKNYYPKLFDFGGKNAVRALNDFNLKLETGKIVGLLGPNGSGKTTFLKIAAGLLKPTEGQLLIDDKEIGKETKAIVSFLPDVNHLGFFRKIQDAKLGYMEFFKDFDENKFKDMLNFMKLSEENDIKSLSKGNVEKLQLSLTLSRQAKLYIFDEPLGGIDPVAREKVIDVIIKNYSGDSTVLISTHLVSEIERVFDDVVFIKSGSVILSGNAEDLRIQSRQSIDQLFKEKFAEE